MPEMKTSPFGLWRNILSGATKGTVLQYIQIGTRVIEPATTPKAAAECLRAWAEEIEKEAAEKEATP